MDECKPLPHTFGVGSGLASLFAEEAGEQGLTPVLISAQLELTLPISAQLKPVLSLIQSALTCGCVPTVLKLRSSMSDVSQGPQVEL